MANVGDLSIQHEVMWETQCQQLPFGDGWNTHRFFGGDGLLLGPHESGYHQKL